MSIENIYAQVVGGNHYDLSMANKHTALLFKAKNKLKQKICLK